MMTKTYFWNKNLSKIEKNISIINKLLLKIIKMLNNVVKLIQIQFKISIKLIKTYVEWIISKSFQSKIKYKIK